VVDDLGPVEIPKAFGRAVLIAGQVELNLSTRLLETIKFRSEPVVELLVVQSMLVASELWIFRKSVEKICKVC
jgi:hypothetical protein